METDLVSETLFFLVFRIPGYGQSSEAPVFLAASAVYQDFYV
jgi:hypothetical protein